MPLFRKIIQSLFNKNNENTQNVLCDIRQLKSPLTYKQLMPLSPLCKYVQFGDLLTDKDHEKLSVFLKNYPDVTLRMYNHLSEEPDLEFLRFYPFLKHFEVEVYTIKNFNGLKHLPENLESLGIGKTKSKNQTLGSYFLFRVFALC